MPITESKKEFPENINFAFLSEKKTCTFSKTVDKTFILEKLKKTTKHFFFGIKSILFSTLNKLFITPLSLIIEFVYLLTIIVNSNYVYEKRRQKM